MCRAIPSGRWSRNAVEAGPPVVQHGAQEAADGGGVVGMGVLAQSLQRDGGSAGGRPYRAKSWSFQVISPVSEVLLEAADPAEPLGVLQQVGQPRRLVLQPPDQQHRVAVAADADGGRGGQRHLVDQGGEGMRSARNGSPVACTCSTLSNSPPSPAASG